MKHRLAPAAVVLSTLAASAGIASAQATLLNDLRELSLEVQINADNGADQQQVEYFPSDLGDDPFLDWGASDGLITLGGFSASARASGASDTTVSSTLITGTAEATGSAAVLDETASDAFALSRAFLTVGFSIDSTQQWLVDAELTDNNAGVARLAISDGAKPGGAELVSWADASVNEVVTLGPGSYTLSARAEVIVSLFASPSSDMGIANFDVRFGLVPAPGSVALLAGAGLLARRRRA